MHYEALSQVPQYYAHQKARYNEYPNLQRTMSGPKFLYQQPLLHQSPAQQKTLRLPEMVIGSLLLIQFFPAAQDISGYCEVSLGYLREEKPLEHRTCRCH